MFKNINRAIDNLACRGAVLYTYSNGNQLIDMDIRNRNMNLISLGGNAIFIASLIGLSKVAELVRNR